MPATVRSALFVPATRPDRISKARSSGADAVIIDLEDAVAPDDKDRARDQLRDTLREPPAGDAALWVRVNAADTRWFAHDLAACAELRAVTGIMLPKAESADALRNAAAAGKPLWPLLESAPGFLNLAAIATAPGVERLAFGALDTALALNLHPGDGADTALDNLRVQLIVHSQAARLAAPLETVVPEFRDSAPVRRTARRARQMGFGGMLCIHPAQLPAIHDAFAISDEQRDWSRRVLAGAERHGTPFQLDGKMVDEPVIERARRLLGGRNG